MIGGQNSITKTRSLRFYARFTADRPAGLQPLDLTDRLAAFASPIADPRNRYAVCGRERPLTGISRDDPQNGGSWPRVAVRSSRRKRAFNGVIDPMRPEAGTLPAPKSVSLRGLLLG